MEIDTMLEIPASTELTCPGLSIGMHWDSLEMNE